MNRCKHRCIEGNLVVPMRWPMDFVGAAARSIPEIDHVKLPSQPLSSLLVRTPQVKTQGPYRRLSEYIEKDDKRNLRISLFGWELICVYFIVFILIICVIRFELME
ncbi:uncharacterized protein LOC133670484 [Populus nigra]|uniref:uncharacterized protein LOC133670484 n=1 Tax=Populus nigra TaxID=3691 RepID=UPI002B26D2FD|nr:uncharacterized protein LOC133670484 [Populus nigra]